MVTATFYYNTGFNAVNIPASPAVLEAAAMAQKVLPVMDIIQLYHISSIAVKASESELYALDYVKLTDGTNTAYYHYADTYAMTSADVAVLSIYMDPLLTAGGINSITALGGKIKRTTYIHENAIDNYNETWYSMIDEALTSMYTERHWLYPLYTKESGSHGSNLVTYKDGVTNSANPSVYGHTVNLYGSSYDLNIAYPNEQLTKIMAPFEITKQLTGSGDAEKYVFSDNYNNRANQILELAGQRHEPSKFTIAGIERIWPGLSFFSYDAGAGDSFGALNVARTLYTAGVANVIAVSYQIPGQFISKKTGSRAASLAGIYQYAEINATISEMLSGLDGYDNILLTAIKNSTVTIRLHAIGTGEISECRPQNLRKYGSADIDDKIRVYCISDPTPAGCPFFKLDIEQTEKVAGGENFLPTLLTGAIRGAQWMPVPVSFTDFNVQKDFDAFEIRKAYGTAILNSQWERSWQNTNTAAENYKLQDGANFLTNIGNGVKSFFGGGSGESQYSNGGYQEAVKASGWLGGLIQNLTGRQIAENNFNNDWNAAVVANAQKQMAFAQELSEFEATHTRGIIDLQYAVTDGSQFFTSNGALLEVIMPREDDIKNMVKFMQRFGVALDSPFTSGFYDKMMASLKTDKYAYIQTQGADVATVINASVPRSVYRELAQLLDGGVRIWSQRPDPKLYDSKFKKGGK